MRTETINFYTFKELSYEEKLNLCRQLPEYSDFMITQAETFLSECYQVNGTISLKYQSTYDMGTMYISDMQIGSVPSFTEEDKEILRVLNKNNVTMNIAEPIESAKFYLNFVMEKGERWGLSTVLSRCNHSVPDNVCTNFCFALKQYLQGVFDSLSRMRQQWFDTLMERCAASSKNYEYFYKPRTKELIKVRKPGRLDSEN